MSKFRKFLYILSWIPALLIKFAFWLVGLVIIPVALLFGSQKKWRAKERYFPRIFFLWDNKEEGCPQWWLNDAESGEEGKFAKKFPKWWWFAIRNPVNGMRYVFKDREAKFDGWQSHDMEAHDLLEAGVTKAARWAYSGIFAGYRVVEVDMDAGTYSEFWIGWKVGSDVEGMGLTIQRRKDREIGT